MVVTCPGARKPGTEQIILNLSEIRGDGGLKLKRTVKCRRSTRRHSPNHATRMRYILLVSSAMSYCGSKRQISINATERDKRNTVLLGEHLIPRRNPRCLTRMNLRATKN